jgi:hypothetical protein
MTQGPEQAKMTTTGIVRTEVNESGKYPEHVVEVETPVDEQSLALTALALTTLAYPSEFAAASGYARDVMAKFATVMDDLDRSTALLKLAVGHCHERDSYSVKLTFTLEGKTDGYSDAEIEEANRRADELDAEYLERHPEWRV